LEDLLYGGSEDFIERVEREAAVNEKFRYSLSISRNPNLILKNPSREEEIQQRIVNAVRNDLPHTQGLKRSIEKPFDSAAITR
jgi:hypothetical protein